MNLKEINQELESLKEDFRRVEERLSGLSKLVAKEMSKKLK